MKPVSEIEENLANKVEPILGFKPSSKIKRGPMEHTHLILEAEMGCSHLLSTMETASASEYVG